MEIQKQRKLLPTSQTGRIPLYSQGNRRKHVAKFFLIVLVFISVNFSNASIKVKIKHKRVKLIYILLWTPHTKTPFAYWSTGRKDLIQTHCPVTNCYVTANRNYFGGDMKKFDAILFNGRNLYDYNKSDLPKTRSHHQKYIYVNMESSDNQPICNPIFDNFFNWTGTYKLSSDIVFSYFSIINKTGREIGPRTDMTWINPMSEVNETLKMMLRKKTKAVAWFVSHCGSRSKREEYALKLKKSLRSHHLTLDIFGKCGPKKCPRRNLLKCLYLLNKDYYFYLSFENSFSEDYVTEKVIIPLAAGAAPVVYGGANYSRFLPPGSYIDARKYTPKKLAQLISYLIANPAQYQTLFRWRNNYTYFPVIYPVLVCKLCIILNAQAKFGFRKVYRNFRRWWNADYKKRCNYGWAS